MKIELVMEVEIDDLYREAFEAKLEKEGVDVEEIVQNYLENRAAHDYVNVLRKVYGDYCDKPLWRYWHEEQKKGKHTILREVRAREFKTPPHAEWKDTYEWEITNEEAIGKFVIHLDVDQIETVNLKMPMRFATRIDSARIFANSRKEQKEILAEIRDRKKFDEWLAFAKKQGWGR